VNIPALARLTAAVEKKSQKVAQKITIGQEVSSGKAGIYQLAGRGLMTPDVHNKFREYAKISFAYGLEAMVYSSAPDEAQEVGDLSGAVAVIQP